MFTRPQTLPSCAHLQLVAPLTSTDLIPGLLANGAVNESLHWEVPLVAQGAHTPPLDSDGVNPPKRTEAWETDEEYGRQFVAGQNPLIFNAPSALPKGCSITGTDIDGARRRCTRASVGPMRTGCDHKYRSPLLCSRAE